MNLEDITKEQKQEIIKEYNSLKEAKIKLRNAESQYEGSIFGASLCIPGMALATYMTKCYLANSIPSDNRLGYFALGMAIFCGVGTIFALCCAKLEKRKISKLEKKFEDQKNVF